MKKTTLILISFLFAMNMSCQRASSQTWENMKTAGRYLNKSFNSLLGRPDELAKAYDASNLNGPEDAEYISLNESDLRNSMQYSDFAVEQPKFWPGDANSGMPSLAAFHSPQKEMAVLFKTLHFATDDHIVRAKEDLEVIYKMAQSLKEHPKLYICIEGHCDERASASYNMALGSRRANQVRSLLIKQGVSPEHLYPISYGKERPVSLGHTKEDFDKNRRCEFKLYFK